MAKLNESNMIFLTASEEGPVGLTVRAFAEDVVTNARDNVREILRNYSGNIDEILDAVDYDVIETSVGLEAFIGIRNTGKLSAYLASKEDNEQVWLRPALEEAKADYQTSIPAFHGAHVSRGGGGRFARLETA
jgi:hypothetical protein